MHIWSDVLGRRFIALGTNKALFVYYDGAYYDITPLGTALTSCTFTSSNGSPTVTVNKAAHGLVEGDLFLFSSVTLPGGSTIGNSDATLLSDTGTQTVTNKSIDSDNNTITNIVNADIKSSAAIADTKLATISTAGKVALTALEIDGGSDIGADLTTSDLIIVDDGAGGTNRKAALSRVVTLMTAQGFSTEDPTALAIALG